MTQFRKCSRSPNQIRYTQIFTSQKLARPIVEKQISRTQIMELWLNFVRLTTASINHKIKMSKVKKMALFALDGSWNFCFSWRCFCNQSIIFYNQLSNNFFLLRHNMKTLFCYAVIVVVSWTKENLSVTWWMSSKKKPFESPLIFYDTHAFRKHR